MGRTVVGGGDTSLPTSAYDAIAKATTGRSPQAVARSQIRGDAGRYVVTRDRRSGKVIDRDILYDKSLTPTQAERILTHEVPHVIDEVVGRIPVKNLNTELRQVYNTLNTGQERTRHLTGPEHLKYKGAAIDRELMAEAMRAYMADPNYMKTVAPKTAARIRQHVNSNPNLNKTIQFNSLLGPALGVSAYGAYQLAPEEPDTVVRVRR